MNKNESSTRRAWRDIWKRTTTTNEGRHRLLHFNEPWLIENYIDHAGKEFRVKFPDGRSCKDLPFWERVQRFRQAKDELLWRAAQARFRAMSYRNFDVGSAVLAFRSKRRHKDAWGVFGGMNTKHARNMRPVCAEPIAINAAYEAGFDLIIGIVVVGELREEDVGTIKTLHPCQECRWFMHGHPIVDEKTLVMTALPSDNEGDHDIHETRTVGRLLKLHQRISADDFT
jgi:cytidine deaminase